VEQQLDEVFSAYAATAGPGLVVGIKRRGRQPYRRAFGRSSIEAVSSNTIRTRMRIGSSTKQFTCLGVLLLAEDGRLDIDDDIRTHLPELPEYAEPVTIRQLMSNTGGLRCYLDLIGILASIDRAVPAPLPVELQLRQRSVNFSPGARLLYCNGGYLLLSRLIERRSDMPLAEFFSSRIFEPLGMSRTVFEPSDTKFVEDSATLHQRYPDNSYRRGTLGLPITGDGAILSDVDDMLAWLAHMDAPVIGNSHTWTTFLSAGTQTSHGYGFGLMHLPYRGVRTIQHGGTVFGGRCQALKVPEHGIDIIIMSNASDIQPAELTDRVLDVLLDGKLGPPLEPTTADAVRRLEGTYYSDRTGDEVTIITKDGRAFVDGETGALPLYDIDGGFRTNVYALGIEIRPDGDKIELSQGGHHATLERVGTIRESPLAQYCGEYTNEDCRAQAFLEDGSPPRLRIRSPYGSAEYALEPLHGKAWFARLQNSWLPVKIRVEFVRNALCLSTERTKRLEFIRAD
jgi:CubicO group peptidase (beta-lactamase class C family)